VSITLKLTHVDGLRLRQQVAHEVERVAGNLVTKGKDWKFEKHQIDGHTREELDQDRDYRRVGADGKKEPLGYTTVYITHGMKNVVIELKGKPQHYQFRNNALRNQMRMRHQTLKPVMKGDKPAVNKDGKPLLEWQDSGQPAYVPPNTAAGAHIGDGIRIILDEMPT